MSKKAERQLKELRRLMPWTWDARVDQHPPGEKAMQDFEDVLNYKLEERKRRTTKPPSPISKPPVKPQTTKARLSPEDQDPAAAADDIAVHNESSSPADHITAATVERTPAIGLTKHRRNTTTTTNTTEQQQPFVTPAINGKHHHTTTTTTAHHGTTTIPSATGKHETPGSKPYYSEHRPALADGQFQPTPLPTPATLLGKTTAGTKHHASFRSPLPRTVFANKKRRTDNTEQGDAMLLKQVSKTSSTVSVMETPKEVERKTTMAHDNGDSSILVNPPVPKTTVKGARTPSSRRPHSRPLDVSFLSNNNTTTAIVNNSNDNDHNDAMAAALVQSLSAGRTNRATSTGQQQQQRTTATATAGGVVSNNSTTPHRRQQQRISAQRQAALDRDARAMVRKYAGKGAVLTRPPTCPPLFKQPQAEPSSYHMTNNHTIGNNSNININNATTITTTTKGPLPPSANKRAEAVALSNGMFAYERSLLACMSASAQNNNKENNNNGGNGGGVIVNKNNSGTTNTTNTTTNNGSLGVSLAWACNAIKALQQHNA